MKDFFRLSVCVVSVAALSLPHVVRAIGLTVDVSSVVKSEITVNLTTQTDANEASNPSFPQPTSQVYSGAAAAANWSYENHPTWAEFSADTVTASAITGLATSENTADLVFTLTEGVNYSITGEIHATGQSGQMISVSVFFEGEGTLVDIDETVPYLPFLTKIDFDEIPAEASDVTSGFLPAGDYTLRFSLGVINTTVYGSNSISGSFSIVLGDKAVSTDPLIGGTPVDDLPGWYLSEWLGYYNTTFAPFLFHDEHGWLYRLPGSTNATTYFYDYAMKAWWATSDTYYPSIYLFEPPADRDGKQIGSGWVWYQKGTKGPRKFYVLVGINQGLELTYNP